jgi:large subunit ribosomal protein L3
MLRSGVIAKKVGMTRLFLEDGKQVPVTVLQLDNVQVVAQRTLERDGYTAVQLGAGTAKAKRTTQPMRGHFAKAQVEPKRKIASSGSIPSPDRRGRGDHRGPLLPRPVRGRVRHLHRQGLCRRHEAAQLRRPARLARRVGVAPFARLDGQCQDPGKVFKGKKMAGHMGTTRVTTQNLQVVRIDTDRGLVMVKGAVPGSKGGWVTVKDAVKKPQPENVILPGRAALGGAEAKRLRGGRGQAAAGGRAPRARAARPSRPPSRRGGAAPMGTPARHGRRPEDGARRESKDYEAPAITLPASRPDVELDGTRSSASSRAPTFCSAWCAGSRQAQRDALTLAGGVSATRPKNLPPEGHRARATAQGRRSSVTAASTRAEAAQPRP